MAIGNFRPIVIDQQWRVFLFWSRVNVVRPDKCWDWKGSPGPEGYGNFSTGGENQGSHRVAYFLANGIDPGEMEVCHHCDRPICCNPVHLFIGTIADNIRDAVVKGRNATGERNGNSKLKLADVIEIRRLYDSRLGTSSSIAAAFGISRHTATLITRRLTWKHVA